MSEVGTDRERSLPDVSRLGPGASLLSTKRMSTSNDAGPSTSTTPKELSDKEKSELDKILNREAAAFQRDLEVS